MVLMANNPKKLGDVPSAGKIELVSIEDINVDKKFQVRKDGLNTDPKTVEEYKELYCRMRKDGQRRLPPVKAARIKGVLYLIEGHHRLAAAAQEGLTEIEVEIFDDIDEKTALWIALGSNKHGLQLSAGDKSEAVKRAIQEFPDLANTVIADQVGCKEGLVRKIKKKNPDRENDQDRKVVGKDGKMQSARKKKAKPKKEKPASQPMQDSEDDANKAMDLAAHQSSPLASEQGEDQTVVPDAVSSENQEDSAEPVEDDEGILSNVDQHVGEIIGLVDRLENMDRTEVITYAVNSLEKNIHPNEKESLLVWHI